MARKEKLKQKKRNYRREYIQYYGHTNKNKRTKLQNLHRLHKSSRGKARAKISKTRKIPKKFDVHHKDGNPLNNKISNLQIVHRKINRSI